MKKIKDCYTKDTGLQTWFEDVHGAFYNSTLRVTLGFKNSEIQFRKLNERVNVCKPNFQEIKRVKNEN